MEERYVRIPKELICDTSIDEKRVMVYSAAIFLRWSQQRNISDLVNFCGLVPRPGEGKINFQMRDILRQLIERGYLLEDYSHTELHGFGIIHFDEFTKVADLKRKRGSRFAHARCLLLLAYIRQKMIKRTDEPEYLSTLISKIAYDIGIEPRRIPECTNVLMELGILHCEELSRYSDSGNWHTNVRIYVDRTRQNDASYNYIKEMALAKEKVLSDIYESKGIRRPASAEPDIQKSVETEPAANTLPIFSFSNEPKCCRPTPPKPQAVEEPIFVEQSPEERAAWVKKQTEFFGGFSFGGKSDDGLPF